MAEQNSTPTDDDFDRDVLAVDVCHVLLQQPVISRREWGSASGAKIAMLVDPEIYGEVHPESVVAMRTLAVVEGTTLAIIRRLSEHFHWTPGQIEAAEEALKQRRRIGTCEGRHLAERCDKKTAPTETWCSDCESEFKAEIQNLEAEEQAERASVRLASIR